MTRIVEASIHGRRVSVTLRVPRSAPSPAYFSALLEDFLTDAYGHAIAAADEQEIERDMHDLFADDGAAVLGVEVSA